VTHVRPRPPCCFVFLLFSFDAPSDPFDFYSSDLPALVSQHFFLPSAPKLLAKFDELRAGPLPLALEQAVAQPRCTLNSFPPPP